MDLNIVYYGSNHLYVDKEVWPLFDRTVNDNLFYSVEGSDLG
jgi:hypothetical protein